MKCHHALLMGYGPGIPGAGDEKNHLYTITNEAFAESVLGLKWSEAFPGVPSGDRVGHNAMISLLTAGETGDASAIDALTDFVVTEGYVAAFDPNRGFVVVQRTVAAPPVGGNVVP